MARCDRQLAGGSVARSAEPGPAAAAAAGLLRLQLAPVAVARSLHALRAHFTEWPCCCRCCCSHSPQLCQAASVRRLPKRIICARGVSCCNAVMRSGQLQGKSFRPAPVVTHRLYCHGCSSVLCPECRALHGDAACKQLRDSVATDRRRASYSWADLQVGQRLLAHRAQAAPQAAMRVAAMRAPATSMRRASPCFPDTLARLLCSHRRLRPAKSGARRWLLLTRSSSEQSPYGRLRFTSAVASSCLLCRVLCMCATRTHTGAACLPAPPHAARLQLPPQAAAHRGDPAAEHSLPPHVGSRRAPPLRDLMCARGVACVGCSPGTGRQKPLRHSLKTVVAEQLHCGACSSVLCKGCKEAHDAAACREQQRALHTGARWIAYTWPQLLQAVSARRR